MQSFVETRGEYAPGDIRRASSHWIAAAYLAAVAAILIIVELAPKANTDVAVLTAPWASPRDAAQVVGRAGGNLVGLTRLPWAIIAHPASSGFVFRA